MESDMVSDGCSNLSLKEVLKTFQTTAVYTLGGPTETLQGRNPVETGKDEAFHSGNSTRLKTPFPNSYVEEASGLRSQRFLQRPLLLAQDSSVTVPTETILEDKTISCFVIGGEKRLCVPEILQKILSGFDLNEIHRIYEELHIFTSLCTCAQLCALKNQRTIPQSAATCGLITRTYAERLCSRLLHRCGDAPIKAPPGDVIWVQHQCFGKCSGLFYVSLYTSSAAQCIMCYECGGMFAPSEFVCHVHRGLENRTCHWGFDSSLWRNYLLLAGEDKQSTRARKLLSEVKRLYNQKRISKRCLANNCSSKTEEENIKDKKKARHIERTKSAKSVDCTRVDGQFVPSVLTSPLLRVKREALDEKSLQVLNPENLSLADDEDDVMSSTEITKGQFARDSGHRHFFTQRKLEEEGIVAEVLQQQSVLMEAEIRLLNLVLDRGTQHTSEMRQRVVNDFMDFQKQHLSLAAKLIENKKVILQELKDFKKGLNKTVASANREAKAMDERLAVVVRLNSAQLEEAEAENERLRNRVEAIVRDRRSNFRAIKASCKVQVKHFRHRLQGINSSNEFLYKKISELRERLARHSSASRASLSYDESGLFGTDVVQNRLPWHQ